ncbi:MAG TPA: hypothetical protein VJV79_15175 [Polyangiaceae bacterium]|nr:hypothetical protein [Polyangiaceae bacterium]
MKRLLDTSDHDPLNSRARGLIRALGPTLESPDRMQRVRRSLDAARGPRSAPRWALRLALAAALLGASAAAAAAAGVFSNLLSHEPPASAQRFVPPQPAQPPPVALRDVADEPPPAASPQAPPPLLPAAPPAVERALASRQPSASPSSDVARVHEAAKALRRDGDPARALQLLERSGAPVSGPLAEEALALRIEASAASGNGRASKLASAYLARYPNGRYRELAKKVIAGRAP